MTTRAEAIEAAARALLDAMASTWGDLGEVESLRAAIALPPDPPLARETAMLVAEAAFALGALTSRRKPLDAGARLATIVDRIVGPASEVERAEREVVESALIFTSPAHDDADYLLASGLGPACDALRAARERAGQ